MTKSSKAAGDTASNADGRSKTTSKATAAKKAAPDVAGRKTNASKAAPAAAGKPAAGKGATGGKAATKKTPGKKAGAKKTKGGAAAAADAVLVDEHPPSRIAALADELLDEREKTATLAARVLGELLQRKPELLVGHVERFAHGLTSGNKRVVQTSSEALPTIARHAPARVARHLDTLKSAFDDTTSVGQDGLVRTFANLCIASVAYQKRLEPILTKALGLADGRVLVDWADVVLPALKGEPHARARAVVEDRLPDLERPTAQKLADYLGVKLRPVPR
ncbi:MAG TPA: hypothetical protein RMF84_08745 [Polyangiaceae bacterium LLY-WYZ-14_1]|nr:hypothetical protein [Polyangiaceae bacterium LLY-WYZ-14_1]